MYKVKYTDNKGNKEVVEYETKIDAEMAVEDEIECVRDKFGYSILLSCDNDKRVEDDNGNWAQWECLW